MEEFRNEGFEKLRKPNRGRPRGGKHLSRLTISSNKTISATMLHDSLYYGDNGVVYMPSHEYYRLKRQEELRRQWEAEQALRREWHDLKRRDEQQRRRRELERHDALMKQRLEQDRVKRLSQSKPEYQLVRGRDGLIYRVPVSVLEARENHRAFANKQSTDTPQEGQANVLIPHDSGKATERIPDKIVEPVGEDRHDEVAVPEHSETEPQSQSKMSVVVEDASDSEDDDDDFKSVWRNRRPSPGQWIEPVDAYV